jgi:hypothetical protein
MPIPNDPEALAKLLGNAGLKYDEPPPETTKPPAMIAPVPSDAAPMFSLPPDVAARAEKQNAVANVNGPVTQAPAGAPSMKQEVFAKPPAQPQMGIAPGFGARGGGGGTPANPFAKYYESLEAQKGAMGDVARAESQMVDDQGIAAGLKGQTYGQQVADTMAKANERDAQAARAAAQIDEASKKAADMKEDPDHFWNNQGFADKSRLILASALGGFVSGYRGGPNQALNHINGMIDRDIAAQRKNIEQAHGRVADMKGSLAEMYRRFGNMEQAEAGARILHLQQLDAEAQEHGAAAKSDLVRANADLASRQFQSEIEKQKAALAAKAGSGPDMRAAVVKRMQELRDKAASNGVDMPVDEARNQAMAEIFGVTGAQQQGYAKAPSGEAAPQVPDAPQMSFGEAVQSYLMPGSEAGLKRLEMEQHNARVAGALHSPKGGNIPKGEALEHALKAYSSNPFTPNSVIRQRNEAARALRKGGGGGGDALPDPEDFEEDK